MSADGNIKFTSMRHPPATHGKRAEQVCAVCHSSLRGHPPVLLKSGKSVHVECYFRMQKHSRKDRTQ